MAWTAPMTAGANSTFTAANWNTHIRDNFAETEGAKASVAGGMMVTSAANAITERYADENLVSTQESTASTTYTNLTTTGPAVTISTGTQALVALSTRLFNDTIDTQVTMSFAVSSATTVTENDDWAIWTDGHAVTAAHAIGGYRLITGLTAGSNVFTAKYKTSAGTASFSNRRLTVWAF